VRALRFADVEKEFKRLSEKPVVVAAWINASDFYDRFGQQTEVAEKPEWLMGVHIWPSIGVPKGQAVLTMSDGTMRVCEVGLE